MALQTKNPTKRVSTKNPNNTTSAEGSVSDQNWDERLAELIQYKAKFGTANVPGTHYHWKDEWMNVSYWLMNIRMKQARLSKERHQQLTSLGVTWKGAKEEKEDQLWEEMFHMLVDYQKEHGNCLVPKHFEDNQKLANWVGNQRQAKKRRGVLKDDREAKLDSIGFIWSVQDHGPTKSPLRDERWELKRQELRQFYKEHSHYWVPFDRKNKTSQWNSLSRWVDTQRTLYKKGNYRADRERLLNLMGFPWGAEEKLERQWAAHFGHLKEIVRNKSKSGQETAQVFTKAVLGDNLYGWVRTQRMLNEKGTLDPKRKALLDEIHFEWVRASDKL